MTSAVGIWSLKLTPGKKELVDPAADIRITNVALGDVLTDVSGRTTVKLTFGLPRVDDSDDESEEKRAPVKTVLCSLKPDTLEQTTINLILQEGEPCEFSLVGKNTVYLTGNYIEQPLDQPPFDDEDEMDSDEDAYDLREVSSDVEVNPDDLESDESRFEEVTEELPKGQKRARELDTDEITKPSKAEKKKKQKLEAAKTAEPSPAVAAADSKKEKAGAKNEKKATNAEREIAFGIKILDAKIGTGPMAKKGNTVRMRYIGQLVNGQTFDKNIKGKPFTFHLGRNEVIKGWDEGIVGMQVGGERKLTIPPAMGYGKRGTDGIPPNSTLIFEVKLMEIK